VQPPIQQMIAVFHLDVPSLGAICTIIGSFCGTIWFFAMRLDKRLRDPAFLDSLASRIRPELVFSERGSILVDRGGVAFLASKTIEIISGNAISEDAPKTIIIRVNRVLKLPPILTPMNPEIVYIATHREGGTDWRFEINYSMTTTDERDYIRYYRLEFFD
jgi:hypothetical protein